MSYHVLAVVFDTYVVPAPLSRYIPAVPDMVTKSIVLVSSEGPRTNPLDDSHTGSGLDAECGQTIFTQLNPKISPRMLSAHCSTGKGELLPKVLATRSEQCADDITKS